MTIREFHHEQLDLGTVRTDLVKRPDLGLGRTLVLDSHFLGRRAVKTRFFRIHFPCAERILRPARDAQQHEQYDRQHVVYYAARRHANTSESTLKGSFIQLHSIENTRYA